MFSMPNGIQSKTMWNHTTNLTNIGCFQWHSTGPKDNTIVNPEEREQQIRQLSGKEDIQKTRNVLLLPIPHCSLCKVIL
jgi:hypothetical protein